MELHIAQKEFRVQALDTAQEGKGKKKLNCFLGGQENGKKPQGLLRKGVLSCKIKGLKAIS